ncbi:MAG: PstS family phosphate ABC transporter substrate-binding protein, partial [Spirochaetota bacterium]
MKRKALVIVAVLVLIVSMAVFAGGQKESAGGETEKSQELSGTIRIAGSSTVYPVCVAVAEEFNRLHPKVEIPIQSTGSGGGFKNFFIPGKTDINNASRAIKSSEMSDAEDNGVTPLEFQVGVDGLTVVAHKDNPVDNMTVEQLAHIWRPENPARKWNDVDPSWPDLEFELYGPTAASGTFDYFTAEVVGEEKASRSDYQGTEQDNTIIQAVSGSPGAMGYLGMAYYLENKDKVKALRVNGVAPSIETAKSGEYSPLSRPLFMYVSKDSLKRPEVEAFVRFYLDQIST